MLSIPHFHLKANYEVPMRLLMILVIPPATNAIANPIIAYISVFLPCETFSGSPAEVIN